jgi:hypothetical protein
VIHAHQQLLLITLVVMKIVLLAILHQPLSVKTFLILASNTCLPRGTGLYFTGECSNQEVSFPLITDQSTIYIINSNTNCTGEFSGYKFSKSMCSFRGDGSYSMYTCDYDGNQRVILFLNIGFYFQ